MKLEISLFRFDYKSDYLPYYTKNFIKVEGEKTLLDLLNTINEEYPFGYEKSEKFALVVNGAYTYASITIQELVENFGKELKIDPISIRRSHTDLLINDSDFYERLKILSKFIDDEDKKTYETFKIYFYASNTINYEYDYIGDSVLLLASNLIEKDKSLEKDILKAISNYDCSIQFHTSLENRVLNIPVEIEEKITQLKLKFGLVKSENEIDFFMGKKNLLDFGKFDEAEEIKYDFNDFKLAYFKGLNEDTETSKLLSKLNASLINTPAMTSDLALDTFNENPDFTVKLASTVMLEAFDNGADLLIVDNEKVFNLLDSNRKELSNASGREIILPIIHKNELNKLALGLHNEVQETLNKHIINPEIV